MRAGVISFFAKARNAVFHGKNAKLLVGGTIGYFGIRKVSRAFKSVSDRQMNIGSRYLYGVSGDNIIASGKRGIDANVGGTMNVVKSLYSNRRKY